MPKRRSSGPYAHKFIDQTMVLIAEKGSSREVNLREISRRVGCAHTNVYNYYSSLDELRWAAFRKTLDLYAAALLDGLDDSLTGHAYFCRLIKNMVDFAAVNPGLYRFIASDPIDPESIPLDIVSYVGRMKAYFIEVISVLCADRVDNERAESIGNILLAYLDGETFNLINGRILPNEDIVGRVLVNAEQLFTVLSSSTSDGIDLTREATVAGAHRFPTLEMSP